MAVLARGGYSALTLRALAEALGGSMTLVTHYFPTQSDLMKAVLEHQLTLFDNDLAELQGSSDPAARLRTLLEWFLPDDDESWDQERARVLLAIHAQSDNEWMASHLDRIEQRMRELLREHLRPLVDARDLEPATDMVRMTINGIVLSAVEHRPYWTPQRQRSVLDLLWTALPWKGSHAETT